MCDFYSRDREAENWKVGRFWQIFKKAKDSLPLSLNRRWGCFNAKYIEQGSKKRFRLYANGKQWIFIIFSHYKSCWNNKTDDICFKFDTNFKFKNKSNRICIKKRRKINHGPENRRTVNRNKTKLCVSQRFQTLSALSSRRRS